MKKIEKTLIWIDKRIEHYLKILTRIIFIYTNDNKKTKEAENLLRIALRTAFFLDFYSETGNKDFLKEGEKYKKELYDSLNKKDRQDLQNIERKIVKLFEYEKQVWTKIKNGQFVSNKEIEKFWKMKSADSLFYGRITKIFTQGINFTTPIYVYTQILDIVLDINEYEKDLAENLPNILYMKLSQQIPKENIPSKKEEAIRLAIRHDICDELIKVADNSLKQISLFDFGTCKFFLNDIMCQYDSLIELLGNKIESECHSVKKVLINTPTEKSLSMINNKNYKEFLFREPPKNIHEYIKEHKKLEQLLKKTNIEVINVNDIPLSEDVKNLLNKNPNLIFTRDSVLILPFGAIILNMATTKRSIEPYIMKCVLNKLKIPILLEIPKNIKIEGGDLIFLDQATLLIGYGPRTNLKGISFLYNKLVLDLKIIKKIIAIKVSPSRINLDGVLMPLDNNVILVDKSSVGSTATMLTKHTNKKVNLFEYFKSKNIKIIQINKKEGLLLATNIFNIGNKKLICYKHNKRVNSLLEKYGFKILKLDGSHLIKGSGGPRCMTNPIRYKELND